MHPVEHLRALARARGLDADDLVPEAAHALASFGDDRPALVLAARKLLERQGIHGPLWWLCGTVVTAADPPYAARRAQHDWDRASTQLADAVAEARVQADGDGTPRPLVHALAAGTDGVLIDPRDHDRARVDAADDGLDVVVGFGVALPAVLWNHVRSMPSPRGVASLRVLPTSAIRRIIGPAGVVSHEAGLDGAAVPVVLELLPRG